MKHTSKKSATLFQPKFSGNTRLAIFIHWSKSDRISNHDQNLIHCLASEFDQVLVVCNRNGTSNRNQPLIDNPENKIQKIIQKHQKTKYRNNNPGKHSQKTPEPKIRNKKQNND